MDQAGSMEERVITERIRRKLEEVNAAAQKHLAGVQDHVNFTMQVRAPLNLSSVSTFFFRLAVVYLLCFGDTRDRKSGNLVVLIGCKS